MKLKSIRRWVENAYKSRFNRTPEVVGAVVDRCHEVDSRARIIDRVFAGTMLPELSTRPLARMAEGGRVETNEVGWDQAASDCSYEIG
jgi:ATP-dependent Clp protease ATP-binding subunit ClpA